MLPLLEEKEGKRSGPLLVYLAAPSPSRAVPSEGREPRRPGDWEEAGRTPCDQNKGEKIKNKSMRPHSATAALALLPATPVGGNPP